MEQMKAKLKNLPGSPGVYRFKNARGAVLYVGKAKNLKARLRQYFSGQDTRPQIPYLLAEAVDFDYTVVSSELESLFLENTLIKRFLPRYNIMLRDDKNYAFIKIDYGTEIPQISIARKIGAAETEGKSPRRPRYFGPYSAAHKIRQTLNLVRRIFPYCSSPRVTARPCFYYYLHRCPGVCIGKISLEEYRKQLKRIEEFLSGRTAGVGKQLKREMAAAAKRKQFEAASRLRDQARALELLEERQTVILARRVSWDIVSLATDQGFSCINLFKVREGKLQDRENFIYEMTPLHGAQTEYLAEILQKFLERYYLDTSSVPETIYVPQTPADQDLVEHIIRSRFGRKSAILAAQKGKAKELLRLGQANAEEYLKDWLAGQAGHLDAINRALEGLKTALGLEKLPRRIECYDVSNTQGTNPVGSMVVFEQGLPKKSQYRKFKLSARKAPDDFAMMKEMLGRRLARASDPAGSWQTPDLMVIDGGKGQLSAALEELAKSGKKEGPKAIPVIGLAKRLEEIFLPARPDPLILESDDPALQLLQRLRDEAHRFGLSFHRQLRSRQAITSALDTIPGVGPKTKKLLKQKFGGVAGVRQASWQELADLVGKKLADSIKQRL